MSELQRDGRDDALFPQVPSTEEAHEQYYAKALEQIRAGLPTWVQRNFDDENGRILDFFADKKPVGYIEQETGSSVCDVYAYHEIAGQKPAVLIGQELDLYQAVDALESRKDERARGLKGIYRGMRGH